MLRITELPCITTVRSLNCCPKKESRLTCQQLLLSQAVKVSGCKGVGFFPSQCFYSPWLFCTKILLEITNDAKLEEIRKMCLMMCSTGVFIICVYSKPKTKLPGLTGIFSLTSASFGSAFKFLIHRIQSFAIDVLGVSAFWQIKSSKSPHFEWKSRMCQA